MEGILRPIYQERASHKNTMGIIMVEKGKHSFPVTDTFNTVLLVVVKDAEKELFVKHYQYENQKATLYTVDQKKLREWLLLGSNRKVVDWILNGKILFDRNEYMTNLRRELQEFPSSERQVKMGVEFGKLIRRYQEGKAFFEIKQSMDAYNYVIHALHHLARLAVIEKGFHPEVTVWNQVRKIEPQIYKLYVELLESEESLEKRLELLFLASEFLINSRVKIGGKHLLQVLSTKEDAWTFGEMLDHPDLQVYSVDLEMLVEFLVEKQLIKIEAIETKGKGIYHRKYRLS
ncbi:hypothetical protein LCL95_16760 [Bacillus timonensis]|nr:hypothetical protein [Bacillus timonensis]